MSKVTSRGKSVPKSASVPTEVVKPQPPAPTIIEPKIPQTVPELWAMLEPRLKAIEEKFVTHRPAATGRGPISTRSMVEADAKRIMIGDLKAKTIKECAIELGLSYGQVYSARNGYTFKTQYAERKALEEVNAPKK